MELDKLAQLMREVCADLPNHEACYHNAYSGYGMQGKTTPAISGEFDQCLAVVAEIIKQAIEMYTDYIDPSDIAIGTVVDTMLSFRFDRLGHGNSVMIYWPNIPSIPVVGTAIDSESDETGD